MKGASGDRVEPGSCSGASSTDEMMFFIFCCFFNLIFPEFRGEAASRPVDSPRVASRNRDAELLGVPLSAAAARPPHPVPMRPPGAR